METAARAAEYPTQGHHPCKTGVGHNSSGAYAAAVLTPSAKQVRHLGEGAFASVDECVLGGQHVAVKRLKPELFTNDADLRSFVAGGRHHRQTQPFVSDYLAPLP